MQSTVNNNKVMLTLSGRIDFSSRQRLRAMIEEGFAQGYTGFIFDLHNIGFIDGSGLWALVACCNMVRKQGGHLAFTRVPKRIHDLLELTHLTRFFEICEPLAE
jgi:anti-anti-sigma factor